MTVGSTLKFSLFFWKAEVGRQVTRAIITVASARRADENWPQWRYGNQCVGPIIRSIAIVGLIAVIAACANTPAPVLETRLLSATEKESLRKSLSQTLKDPETAQFKWMPAVVAIKDAALDSPIGYCGLVNGKNSYGGYVGFKRFYATIIRNAKGEYDRGVIQHIEGRPITFGGTATSDDAFESGATEGSCKAWGYVDFSMAN